MVRPTLQILDPQIQNLFAIGDVADTTGPKMARAGMYQAEVVEGNILKMIKGSQKALGIYEPNFIEGVLKLTVGKVCYS